MIRSLSLRNYKNYTSATVGFHNGIHFFVGANGMGKTNLLDAIFYACVARSHNSTTDRDVVQFGQDFFRIEAKLKRARLRKVTLKVKPGEIKEITVDGKTLERLSDYVGFLPVVMLAPEDIVLIQGGSIARRRFMDIVLCQADRGYMDALQRYNRLLSQRNAVLKQDGRIADKNLMLTYTRSMVDPARVIHMARNALTDTLQPEVERYYKLLSNARETPLLKYQSHLQLKDLEALAIASIEEDLQIGRTSRGTHRDELDLFLDDRIVKKYGSQGQIKSLLIALHLAQAEFLKGKTGHAPILLLDDIFDKLDEDRSQRLINLLSGEVAQQVFVTDASHSRVSRLHTNSVRQGYMYHVSEGTVIEIGDNTNEEENGNLRSHEEE